MVSVFLILSSFFTSLSVRSWHCIFQSQSLNGINKEKFIVLCAFKNFLDDRRVHWKAWPLCARVAKSNRKHLHMNHITQIRERLSTLKLQIDRRKSREEKLHLFWFAWVKCHRAAARRSTQNDCMQCEHTIRSLGPSTVRCISSTCWNAITVAFKHHQVNSHCCDLCARASRCVQYVHHEFQFRYYGAIDERTIVNLMNYIEFNYTSNS